MKPVRIILIGAGKMGKAHIEAFQGIPHVEIVAVVSRGGASAQRLAEENRIPYFGSNWKKVAELAKPNAGVVAVSHVESDKVCEELIDAGLHILAEKPVGLHSDKIKTLAEKAVAKGLINQVGVNRRYYPSIIASLDLVRFYGNLNGLTILAPDPVAFYKGLGTYDIEVYENWSVMNTIHVLDIINLSLGKPKKISSFKGVQTQETSFASILEYPDGALCHVICQNNAGGMPDWKLVFHGDGIEVHLGPMEKGYYSVGDQRFELECPAGNSKQSLRAQALSFIEAISNNSALVFPASDFRNHAQSVDIINSMLNSYDHS